MTVAGRGRFDTEVMSLLGARVFTKSGAEGVFCAALPEAGLGLAVKADDGAGRAAQVMIAALIRRFGGFDDETEARLVRFVSPRLFELERRRSRALASRGPAGVTPARVREGRMRRRFDNAVVCSLARRRSCGWPRWRASPSSRPQAWRCAKDRCADTAQAVQALQEGDQYQATTLLFAAARLGCEAQARALLDRGAAIDAKDREGATALAKAAQAGKLPLIRLLLDRGANVNARAVDGSTPLFYAAEAGSRRGDRVCCSTAAPIPTFPARKGVRPLAAAAFNGSAESVELCSSTARIRTRSTTTAEARWSMPPAAATRRSSRLLLQAGVDVNRRYAHGLTALMWAAGHDASAGVDDVEATIKTLIDTRRRARPQGRPRQDRRRHRPRPRARAGGEASGAISGRCVWSNAIDRRRHARASDEAIRSSASDRSRSQSPGSR